MSIPLRRNVEITRKVSKPMTRKFWRDLYYELELRSTYPGEEPVPDEGIVHEVILDLKQSKESIV